MKQRYFGILVGFFSFSLPVLGSEKISSMFSLEEIAPDQYCIKQEAQLYICMEKLEGKKAKTWSKYVEHERKWLSKGQRGKLARVPRVNRYSEDFFLSAYNTTEQFLDVLRFSLKRSSENPFPHEVWVVYALDQDPRNLEPDTFSHHIEMAVTVSTHLNVPFQMHMGIFRWISYLLRPAEEAPLHRNLAAYLHGIAAKVMLARDPSKRFMITTPLQKMLEILRDQLPTGTVWIGRNNEKSPILERYFQFFHLRDPVSKKIFFSLHSNGFIQHKWFFTFVCPDLFPYLIVELSTLAKMLDPQNHSPMPGPALLAPKLL